MKRALLLLGLAALGPVACSKAIDPPPIEITFRASLLGAGKIVQVKSTSNERIEGIEVALTAPNGDAKEGTGTYPRPSP